MTNLIKLNEQTMTLAAIAVALIGSAVIMGFAGLRVLAVMMLLFIVPTYLILNSLKLECGEQFFFALFLGLIVMPLGTFYLNLFIASMKASAIIFWLLMVGVGIFLFLRKKKSL